MATFPDIHVFMDDVVFGDEAVESHWTLHRHEHGTRREQKPGSDLWLRGMDVQ